MLAFKVARARPREPEASGRATLGLACAIGACERTHARATRRTSVGRPTMRSIIRIGANTGRAAASRQMAAAAAAANRTRTICCRSVARRSWQRRRRRRPASDRVRSASVARPSGSAHRAPDLIGGGRSDRSGRICSDAIGVCELLIGLARDCNRRNTGHDDSAATPKSASAFWPADLRQIGAERLISGGRCGGRDCKRDSYIMRRRRRRRRRRWTAGRCNGARRSLGRRCKVCPSSTSSSSATTKTTPTARAASAPSQPALAGP